MEKVYVLGHRGASYHAPENTEAAFLKAYELGADGIETDVQITADNQLVINHNYLIDENSDGKGRISDMTLEQLREYNFNVNKPEYGRQKILTLDECLEITGKFSRINLEMKSPVTKKRLFVEKVAETIGKHSLWGKVIVSSFDHELLSYLKTVMPVATVGTLMTGFGCTADMLKGMFSAIMPFDVPADAITWEMLKPFTEGKSDEEAHAQMFEAYEMGISIAAMYPGSTMDRACELMAQQSDIPQYISRLNFRPEYVHPEENELLMVPAYAQQLLHSGYGMNVWTADDPANIEALIAMGCRGIITNRCDIAVELAKKANAT